MDWRDVEIGKKVIEKVTKKSYIIIGRGEDFFMLGDIYVCGVPGGWKNSIVKKATKSNLRKYKFA